MLDRRVLLLALAVTAALLVGCSSDSTTGDLTGLEKEPPTTHVGSSDGPGSTPEEVVEHLAVGAEDLRAGERAVPDATAERIEGTFTLTYCRAPFPSNGKRQARHAVTIGTADKEAGTTEAVLYDEGVGEEAMAELRDAVATCPAGLVEVDGDPPQSHRATPIPAAEVPGLAKDRVAQAEVDTLADGTATTRYRIYQRRGDALVVTTSANKADAIRLATNAAIRLETLSPEQTTG